MVLSSAIVFDAIRDGDQPLDSIWIADHDRADDRRPYCDLRSAIRDHMETSLYRQQLRGNHRAIILTVVVKYLMEITSSAYFFSTIAPFFSN